MRFLCILRNQSHQEALLYARSELARFATRYSVEFQQLMGCFLYQSRLESSPYSSLTSEALWTELVHEFSRDCCRVLGIAQESPLHTVVAAGSKALPTLLKASRMSFAVDWSNSTQLPVELELDREFQFHSIFVCPVSRDESNADNPPMILPCGHVLCKNSISRLPRGNSRFKCPYCPSEQVPSECREISF